MPMLTTNLAKASRSLHIKVASLSSEPLMPNRYRFMATVRHALLNRGLVALLLPLGLLFLAWWCPRHKVPVWRMADAMAPAILLAIILVRWGNFMNGELYGDPTSLPWGMVFPEVPGGPRHPVQLYEMMGTVLILAWVLAAAGRRPFDGYLFWSAIVASSALRFLLDLLRSDDRTAVFLTWGQMAALVLIGWGAAFLRTRERAAQARPSG